MTDREFLKHLGMKIGKFRKGQAMSQMDFGSIINMEKSNLSAIENGRQNASSLTLKKIADALGCNVRHFFSNPF